MKKNPIFSEETLELVEASILQLAEDVIRLKDEEEAFRNLFADVSSNQHIHDQPLVATKRYYQDRVVGDTGEFTLNGNYGDVRALSAFLHDNSFDEDEEWRKALELMLTQEAYMGFSHLSAQAYSQGNHLEVIQKCDVIMEKVADEEVRVQIAFPVHVKSKEWLPEAIELQARKEFCLRKEEGKIALIDYKARLV